jgi:hypothetical protein
MRNDLYSLTHRAQNGDEDALNEIITMLGPAIRSARSKVRYNLQDDVEQDLVEIIIKKIKSYDLSHTPDYSSFCHELKKERSK